jgi:hypothetical protein
MAVSLLLTHPALYNKTYHILQMLIQSRFLIEGVITASVGIASWVMMPASPCQTSGRGRGKAGWFTEHEEKIMVNRLLRDDPSKGDMNNRYAIVSLVAISYNPGFC